MGRIVFILVLICFSAATLVGCASDSKTYLVSVGVADYENIQDLRLSEKDAESVVQLFENRGAITTLLIGEKATKANILRQLKEQFLHVNSQDLVVFYFSGHGYPGGFCPYDMNQQLASGLSYEEIKAVFKDCKARNKVVFADACYAGKFRQNSKSSSTASSAVQADSPAGTNVLLFLSSRSGETSIEYPYMKNGLFTASLMRALRGGADIDHDRLITAKELFSFVSQNVKEKSRDKQHPVMWGKFDDNMVVMDWKK